MILAGNASRKSFRTLACGQAFGLTEAEVRRQGPQAWEAFIEPALESGCPAKVAGRCAVGSISGVT